MNILMVNKYLYGKGGADIYMLKAGEQLVKAGHRVEYFGMSHSRNTVGNSAGEYTAEMDFHTKSVSRFTYPFRIIYSREAAAGLKRVISSFKPHVIHMNNINYQLTPSVIDAAWEMGIPVVQTVHDFQIICPNHMLFNLQERAVCQRCVRGSKWNCTRYSCIHGSRVRSIIGSLEACLYMARDNYRRVAKYICPSRFMEEMLLKGRPDLKDRTCVIHNFIQLPPEDLRLTKAKEKYVVMACRLSMEKGIELVSRAAGLVPDVKFRIAGTGPEEKLLRHIPNVELQGYLSGRALSGLIAGAACMIVPSIWYENCPLTILEAQALGTPVITAGIGGMAELVKDGVTGRLVYPLTAEKLAAAISSLTADDKTLARMSRSCLEERKNMITIDRYIKQLEEIYTEVIAAKR